MTIQKLIGEKIIEAVHKTPGFRATWERCAWPDYGIAIEGPFTREPDDDVAIVIDELGQYLCAWGFRGDCCYQWKLCRRTCFPELESLMRRVGLTQFELSA